MEGVGAHIELPWLLFHENACEAWRHKYLFMLFYFLQLEDALDSIIYISLCFQTLWTPWNETGSHGEGQLDDTVMLHMSGPSTGQPREVPMVKANQSDNKWKWPCTFSSCCLKPSYWSNQVLKSLTQNGKVLRSYQGWIEEGVMEWSQWWTQRLVGKELSQIPLLSEPDESPRTYVTETSASI